MAKKQGARRAWVPPLRSFLQRTSFVLEVHSDLEMGNHAAAGALAFLLSAVPVLILSFGVASALLVAFPNETKVFQTWIGRFLGPINLPDATPRVFGQGYFALGTLAAVLGLVYSSRLFFSTIRKTLKVLWGANDGAVTVQQALGGYLVELGALVALVIVLAVSESARSLVYANQDELLPGVFATMTVVVDAVPFVVLWLFFTVSLRLFPARRPSWRRTGAYSLVAVAIFSASAQILRVAINTDQYEMLYGVIANLVVVLLNVSVFFSLYFLTAAYLFVEQNVDALLFGRYYRHWGVAKPPFPDGLLFREPQRLRDQFEQRFPAGTILFHQGDGSDSAYFLEDGEVDIVVDGLAVDRLGPGEIFGETGSLLGEPRSAGARAHTEVRVLRLPAEVFGFYLHSDRLASRKLIAVLAERLKRANARSSSA